MNPRLRAFAAATVAAAIFMPALNALAATTEAPSAGGPPPAGPQAQGQPITIADLEAQHTAIVEAAGAGDRTALKVSEALGAYPGSAYVSGTLTQVYVPHTGAYREIATGTRPDGVAELIAGTICISASNCWAYLPSLMKWQKAAVFVTMSTSGKFDGYEIVRQIDDATVEVQNVDQGQTLVVALAPNALTISGIDPSGVELVRRYESLSRSPKIKAPAKKSRTSGEYAGTISIVL